LGAKVAEIKGKLHCVQSIYWSLEEFMVSKPKNIKRSSSHNSRLSVSLDPDVVRSNYKRYKPVRKNFFFVLAHIIHHYLDNPINTTHYTILNQVLFYVKSGALPMLSCSLCLTNY
jgi:hypothetical protein